LGEYSEYPIYSIDLDHIKEMIKKNLEFQGQAASVIPDFAQEVEED